MAYWDASCVIKRYVPERDSLRFQQHVIGGATVRTSRITRLELFTTLRRKVAEGDLTPVEADSALANYDHDIAAGQVTVRRLSLRVERVFQTLTAALYQHTPMLPLRTLDAIHLATATVLAEPELVTTDKRLRDAAALHGLAPFPP